MQKLLILSDWNWHKADLRLSLKQTFSSVYNSGAIQLAHS